MSYRWMVSAFVLCRKGILMLDLQLKSKQASHWCMSWIFRLVFVTILQDGTQLYLTTQTLTMISLSITLCVMCLYTLFQYWLTSHKMQITSDSTYRRSRNNVCTCICSQTSLQSLRYFLLSRKMYNRRNLWTALQRSLLQSKGPNVNLDLFSCIPTLHTDSGHGRQFPRNLTSILHSLKCWSTYWSYPLINQTCTSYTVDEHRWMKL